MKIDYILFDAANTLIHKPQLWVNLLGVLNKNNIGVSENRLKTNHKLLSEAIRFPDRTSKEFYQNFNAELLYSFGIVPTQKLLDEIFEACTYLSWQAFDDTEILKSLNCKIGIVSNFNSTLIEKIEGMFGKIFTNIIISENFGVAKPNVEFYKIALKEVGVAAQNVLYFGDSIKLDVEPAQKLGINAMLIDRDNIYPNCENRITNMQEITKFL